MSHTLAIFKGAAKIQGWVNPPNETLCSTAVITTVMVCLKTSGESPMCVPQWFTHTISPTIHSRSIYPSLVSLPRYSSTHGKSQT